MIDSQFYKGSLQPILLKMLQDNGKMYGYEMTQKIKSLSNNQIEIKEGALYPALHKLEAQGIIEVEAEKIDGRIRKYYKFTEFGEKESVNRLQSIVNTLEQLQQLLQLQKI